MIKVAIGIIGIKNKYLCAQRVPNKQLGLKWEFPGGKLEANETGEQALIRELREELKVEINNISFYENYTYDYGFNPYDLYFYKCNIIGDSNIVLSEHLDYGWFSLEEIKKLDFVESSKMVLKRLEKEEKYHE